jgi:hypothetical protein
MRLVPITLLMAAMGEGGVPHDIVYTALTFTATLLSP